MKAGDLVRVKNTLSGDSMEMRKLYYQGTICLLIDVRLSDEWTHVLDRGTRRIVRAGRLELVNEGR